MRLFFLIACLLLSACDSNVLWEDNPYEVHWIDTDDNITLSIRLDNNSGTIGRVNAKVIAVGSDEKFVVAKQKDANSGSIYYYYLEKSKDNAYLNLSEITKGPFLEKEYLELKTKLNLPDFTDHF